MSKMSGTAFVTVLAGDTGGRRRSAVCQHEESSVGRREVLAAGFGILVGASTGIPLAQALVKGSTPPPDFAKRDAPRDRATNMEEARELGRSKEAEMYGETAEYSVSAGGDRFRDLTVGTGQVANETSQVDIRYRVLKAGKRSADGLAGDGSLIFSFGYGEDDDPAGKTVAIKVDDNELVPALRSSIVGMQEGGIRRIRVFPERGWRKSDGCEKKIDVGTAVGLPGASLSEMESCMDLERVPAPLTFQGKRKLSRRFDGTLVMEIEAVRVY